MRQREAVELLLPQAEIAQPTVQKHDAGAVSAVLVVELDAIDLDLRHAPAILSDITGP